jgi:hypothetical protein
MRTLRPRGFARLGRRAALLASLDVAIVLVIVAHLGGAVATGASPSAIADADPLRLLGQTPSGITCPSAPLAVGADSLLVCPTWTAIVTKSGTVDVVSLYGPDNAVVDSFAGALPFGLAWGDPISAAWAALGRPNRITSAYGTPTLVYFFDAGTYGSLELQFDATQHLTRINASTVH